MKKSIITPLTLLLFFLFFSALPVSAKVLVGKNSNVIVPKDEVVNDDLFVGAQAADIEGTVNGDVFVGAQTIRITGIINGNLHAGANTIFLGGKVKGNVYAGGQNILVNNGTIDGSLLAGAATLNVGQSSSIGGSILAGAGTLTVDSPVGRNVFAGTKNLIVGSGARIGKDLYYMVDDKQKQADISTAAKINGTIHKTQIENKQKNIVVTEKKVKPALKGINFAATFISFFGALVVGYLYFRLFKNDFLKTSELLAKEFWKSLAVGFLVTIAFVPGLIILLITIIGIPVAGLAVLLLLIYMYLAKIVVGEALGNWLIKKLKWQLSGFWIFALGLVAIYILKLIPFIGFLSGLIVLWAGLGAFTVRLFAKK